MQQERKLQLNKFINKDTSKLNPKLYQKNIIMGMLYSFQRYSDT